MAAFILKTEPTSYSFNDLVRDKRTTWDGVSNPVALKHLRSMKRGDVLLIYHTGGEKQIVGTAQAASAPYADPKVADEKRVVVDITAGQPLKRPVTLAEMRGDPILGATDLVRLPRLSVIPLTDAQLRQVEKLAKAQPR